MPPPTNPPPDEPVVPADEQGATDLASDPFCDPSSLDIPAIALSWVPEGTAEQLLALSTLPDGFDTDRYTVTDVLAPDASDASISPVEPGGIYYWRILSRSPDGWIASEIASFSGPTCVLDRPSSP